MIPIDCGGFDLPLEQDLIPSWMTGIGKLKFLEDFFFSGHENEILYD